MSGHERDPRVERFLRRATWALWGRHRQTARDELEDHLLEGAHRHELAGLAPDAALERAIADLGRPERINRDLFGVYSTMRAADAVRLAFLPFRTRALESLLVSLAVAVGVAVVAATTSLLAADRAELAALENGLFARSVRLVPPDLELGAFGRGAALENLVGQQPTRLALADLDAARAAAPAAELAFALDTALLFSGGRDAAMFYEATADYPAAAGLQLLRGSWLSAAELASSARVAVVTERYARETFGTLDAVGRTIPVYKGAPFRVVGVFQPPVPARRDELMQYEGRQVFNGIVPHGSARDLSRRVGGADIRGLFFLPRPGRERELREQLGGFARARWGDRMVVATLDAAFAAQRGRLAARSWVVALFATAGLLVASANLANLMLARVARRTRGLGVSAALGASRALAFRLVMGESLALGLVGGALGVVLAGGLVAAMGRLLSGMPDRAAVPGLGLPAALVGLAAAMVASVVFGAYPAAVAARVRPSEALRA